MRAQLYQRKTTTKFYMLIELVVRKVSAGWMSRDLFAVANLLFFTSRRINRSGRFVDWTRFIGFLSSCDSGRRQTTAYKMARESSGLLLIFDDNSDVDRFGISVYKARRYKKSCVLPAYGAYNCRFVNVRWFQWGGKGNLRAQTGLSDSVCVMALVLPMCTNLSIGLVCQPIDACANVYMFYVFSFFFYVSFCTNFIYIIITILCIRWCFTIALCTTPA